MPNKSSNFNLNLLIQNEKFDMKQINENHSIIDSLPLVYEMGTAYSKGVYGGIIEFDVTWNYKKYVNKTIELNALIELDLANKTINDKPYIPSTYGDSFWQDDIVETKQLYKTKVLSLDFPFILSKIIYRDVNIGGITYNSNTEVKIPRWSSSYGNSMYDLKNSVMFHIILMKQMLTTYSDRTVAFVDVKGVE